MLDPAPRVEQRVRTEPRELVEDGRDVALELRRLVHGDLSRDVRRSDHARPRSVGTPGRPRPVGALQLRRPRPADVVCHRLAAGRGDGCSGERSPSGTRMLLVVDEAWAILDQAPRCTVAAVVVEALTGAWGVQRGSAPPALGPELGGAWRAPSRWPGPGHSWPTPRPGSSTPSRPGRPGGRRNCCRCRPPSASCCPSCAAASRCGRLGERSFLVQHLVGRGERSLVDTDAAMTSGPAEGMGKTL